MKLRTLLFLVGMNPYRKRETCRVHRLNSDRAGRSPKLLSELSTRSYLKQLEHLADAQGIPLRPEKIFYERYSKVKIMTRKIAQNLTRT